MAVVLVGGIEHKGFHLQESTWFEKHISLVNTKSGRNTYTCVARDSTPDSVRDPLYLIYGQDKCKWQAYRISFFFMLSIIAILQ